MVDIAAFALAAALRQFYVEPFTALGLIVHKHGRGWAHSHHLIRRSVTSTYDNASAINQL